MLRSLYIQNYALIEKLDIHFDTGFSVITGETGAGKSIILGAIGLLLGQRADVKAIRQGASKCIIEARFDVSSYGMKSFFEENELEFEDECILRREVQAAGIHGLRHGILQTGFYDMDMARVQRVHDGILYVEAADLIARQRKRDSGGEADTAAAHDLDFFHAFSLLCMETYKVIIS